MRGSPPDARVPDRPLDRIADRATFAALRAARRHHVGPLTVRHVSSPDDGGVRVAFAIGRSVGSAPRRNRIRRQLRAHLARTEGPVPAGSYLVAVGSGAADADGASLRAHLDRALVMVSDGAP